MPYQPERTSPEQDRVLTRILRHASGLGPDAVAVFDLDGCLFDNRPRQVAVFHDFARALGAPELLAVQEQHILDWSLAGAMRQAGVSEDRVQELRRPFTDWFREHFFSGRHVGLDRAMPGAVRLVDSVVAQGVAPVFLTGRIGPMRASTERALRRAGFPLRPDASNLLVKPDHGVSDTDFKQSALRRIRTMGRPGLFLDNEPGNLNMFIAQHPDALVVWLRTDHSPKAPPVHERALGIDGFLYTRGADPSRPMLLA